MWLHQGLYKLKTSKGGCLVGLNQESPLEIQFLELVVNMSVTINYGYDRHYQLLLENHESSGQKDRKKIIQEAQPDSLTIYNCASRGPNSHDFSHKNLYACTVGNLNPQPMRSPATYEIARACSTKTSQL